MFCLLVSTVLVLSASGSPQQQSPRPDLAEFLQGCNQRQSRLQSFYAGGTALRALVTDSVANSLGGQFLSAGNIDRAALDSLIDSFVSQTPYRECYEYSIWVVGPRLVVDRVRDESRDTMLEYLRAMGGEPQPHAALTSERLYITDGESTVGIRDRETVTRVEHFTRDQILSRLDVTLCDWAPVVDDEQHADGQSREFRSNDPASGQGTLVLGKDLLGGHSEVVVVLDTAHGFRPISVRHTSGGVLQSASDFLYDPTDADGFPAAILNRHMQANGPDAHVSVELFCFRMCALGYAVTLPELCIPALRHEVTSTQDGSLVIAREMPAALREAAPEDRLRVALAQILTRWGSADAEFDLDGDGAVGPGDIERAGAHF